MKFQVNENLGDILNNQNFSEIKKPGLLGALFFYLSSIILGAFYSLPFQFSVCILLIKSLQFFACLFMVFSYSSLLSKYTLPAYVKNYQGCSFTLILSILIYTGFNTFYFVTPDFFYVMILICGVAFLLAITTTTHWRAYQNVLKTNENERFLIASGLLLLPVTEDVVTPELISDDLIKLEQVIYTDSKTKDNDILNHQNLLNRQQESMLNRQNKIEEIELRLPSKEEQKKKEVAPQPNQLSVEQNDNKKMQNEFHDDEIMVGQEGLKQNYEDVEQQNLLIIYEHGKEQKLKEVQKESVTESYNDQPVNNEIKKSIDGESVIKNLLIKKHQEVFDDKLCYEILNGDPQSKIWFYTPHVNNNNKPVFLIDNVPVYFKLSFKCDNFDQEVFIVSTSLEINLGNLFDHFVYIRNLSKKSSIDIVNDKQNLYGWKFYEKSLLGLNSKILDPYISLKKNNIKPLTIIIAERVAPLS